MELSAEYVEASIVLSYEDKLKKLESYQLLKGSHTSPESGLCALEFVAYLAGEPHGDRPKCASPEITDFVISCNDYWTDEERQLLKPYLPRIMGTRDGRDFERAKIFAMSAITKISPIAIELIGLKEHAQKMREAKNLSEGIDAAYAANAAANAAVYAANAAHAARSAANAAASAAVYAANAAHAARSAANAANAAYAARAAYAAGRAADDIESRKQIIQECLNLLDAVIDLPAKEE